MFPNGMLIMLVMIERKDHKTGKVLLKRPGHLKGGLLVTMAVRCSVSMGVDHLLIAGTLLPAGRLLHNLNLRSLADWCF